MSRSRTMKLIAGVALPAVLLGALLACSTDSPTAPQQQAGPGPGGASAQWVLNVSVAPKELEVGSPDPAIVTVEVRRADNGVAPSTGTTIVLSASLGEFSNPGSGLNSVALTTVNGLAQIPLFAGSVKGTAFVTAQLEASAGQTTVSVVDVLEQIVAAFDSQNSESNLSVQFRDSSTGNPTEWRWDFGDGATSREQNPAHIFPEAGDWVVTLTASKTGSSDTTSQIVSVTRDPLNEIEANFDFIQDGLTVVFRDTTTGNPTRWLWTFGDGTQSAQQNPTKRYGLEGSYVVTLTASNQDSSGETNQIVTVTRDLFITDITPNSGSATGGTTVTISGEGFVDPLRVFFGGVLAKTVSTSPTQIVVTTPPGVLGTEPCNDNNDSTIGQRAADTAVSVLVELGTGVSQSVPGGYTYLAPAGAACNGD